MAIVFVTVKTEFFNFWVNVYIRIGWPRLVDLVELSVNKVSVNKASRVEKGVELFTTLLKILKDTLKIAVVNTSNSMLKCFFLNK